MQQFLKSSLRKLGVIVTLAASVSGITPSAFAAYPEKLVRIIVPFAPGGGTDLIARTLGTGMSQELGQSVIVENKPGAGTIIGTDAVAKSPPDGYTLLIATFAHAVNPGLQPKLPYATDKAFAPVVLIGRSPNILVVKSDSPYKTVQDVIAAAKAKPGKLNFASQGNGTSAHLAGELFKNLTKVDLTHVPYKGAGPALTDLLGGQVDLMFGTAAAVTPFLQSGKLRALGVTTAERSPAFPNVPTIAESGVAGYAAESWYGLYAPAGTPPDVIAKLNAAAKKAVQSETFRKRAQEEGLIISAGAPAELDTYVRGEEARWKKIVKENNITAN
jgi:tripartite-type tricarboxylate transporter receptor subunit TctC